VEQLDLVEQFPFALQLLLEEQPLLVPHDALSECPPTWHLHSFLGDDAHPVRSPAMAAAMMITLPSVVIYQSFFAIASPSIPLKHLRSFLRIRSKGPKIRTLRCFH